MAGEIFQISIDMGKIFRIPILVLLVFISVDSKAQLISDSLLIDGHYRSFHFNKPSSANTKASLIFVLHGSGGSGKGIMAGAEKLEAISGSENILLVNPDGYKKYWNECRKKATSAANVENINDNSFFNQMIEYFVSKYKINPKQVFAVGTSGGGHMAYKLAITTPEKFRAITAIIANIPDSSNLDCIEKKQPMPVMIINGTADQTNPYNGGEMIISGAAWEEFVLPNNHSSIGASLDGYKGEPVKENLPDTDPTDGKTIEKYTYKVKGKPEVVLLKVINGKHDYPNDINVYLEAWIFFKRQINTK
jgi:polyhydroxybutyrate depolymerase